MKGSFQSTPRKLWLVSSGGHPVLQRAEPASADAVASEWMVRPDNGADERSRDLLMRTMTIVAASRRAAARRLRHRQWAASFTVVTLIVLLCGLTLHASLVSANFAGLSNHGQALLSLALGAAAVLGHFFSNSAHQRAPIEALDQCAGAIDQLNTRLVQAPNGDAVAVHDIRQAYRAALRTCNANHTYTDYLTAKQGLGLSSDLSWRAFTGYAVGVYARPTCLLLGPALTFLLI
jgi:SMODS and SLOG-associating 2TM effector domain family 5